MGSQDLPVLLPMTHTGVTRKGAPGCFLASPNPRNNSCLRCGKLQCRPKLDQPVTENGTTPRNIPLERELTALAAQAAGHETDYGLRDFADARAWPGGVRKDLDCTREIAEEISDASNYAVWGIERIYDRVLAGDPAVLDDYERLMRAHAKIIEAWRELLRESA